MEEVWRSWGERVAHAREEIGLSQRQLASQIGVSQSAINHIEKGRVSPRDDRRMKIATALDLNVEDLFPYPATATREGQ